MLILPTGGRGIGVEGNGSNYPFVQPSADIVGLLADLWLAHEYRDVVLPLKVSWMAGFQAAFDGNNTRVQIQITDAEDTPVFDSTDVNPANYTMKDWGERLRIHEWYYPPNSVCRVVQHRAVPDPPPAWPGWPVQIYPENGVLDERTSELMPERLLTIQEKKSGVTVAGEIIFVNGWNVEIDNTAYPEPLRNTTAMSFSANAGGGPGRYPGCQTPDVVFRTINGIPPDPRGNFNLAADGCYYVRQPVGVGTDGKAVPVPASLDLGNDCGPCCDCDAYVSVQKALLNLEAKQRSVGTLAEKTRDDLIAAIDRWNKSKECTENNILTITAVGTAMTYVDFNAIICNTAKGCMLDQKLTVQITSNPQNTWMPVPGTTYITKPASTQLIPYTPSTPAPGTVGAHFDAINPGAFGLIRVRARGATSMNPTGTTVTFLATTWPVKNPLAKHTATCTIPLL